MKKHILSAVILMLTIVNPKIALSSRGEPFDYFKSINTPLLMQIESYHLTHGEYKIKNNDTIHAWGDLALVLHYYPNHPKALKILGELGLKTKQITKAKRYFKRAIKLFPYTKSTFELYGDFLFNAKDKTKAIEIYHQALKLEPKSPTIHFKLANIYFTNKNKELTKSHAKLATQYGYPMDEIKQKLNISLEN